MGLVEKILGVILGGAKEAVKAIGRGIGKAASFVGDKIDNWDLEFWGDDLQEICSKTSQRVSEAREYDKDTSTVDQTEQIADILADFSSGLRRQSDTIESACRDIIEGYFHQLYETLRSCNFERSVNILERRQRTILSGIDGVFDIVIARRASLSDRECLEILKMPRGDDKRRKMDTFTSKVLNEALDKVCGNVEESCNEIVQEINEEFSSMVDDSKRKLEEFAKKTQETYENRKADIQMSETEIFEPSMKLAAADLLLNFMEKGTVE